MREVISATGHHFRLCIFEATVIEWQPKPGARWRTFAEYATEAEARGRLAELGRLQPEPETTQQEENRE